MKLINLIISSALAIVLSSCSEEKDVNQVNEPKFTITWKNYDGSVLETDKGVTYGAIPTYNGQTPTKPSDSYHTYEFEGWFPKIQSVTQDCEYTASFIENSIVFNVSFDTRGGSAVESQNISYGNHLVKPDDPEKNGYSFSYWEYNGSEWSFDTNEVYEDITLIAHWEPVIYSISYELDGGTNSPLNPTSYTIEQNIALYNPLKTGYKFLGWLNQKGEIIFTISAGTYGNLELTASWEINKYTILWKNYDGSVLETDTNVPYNTIPSYEGLTPSKPADDKYTYAFLGWSPTIEPVTCNTTYIAQFSNTPNVYSLTVLSEDTTKGKVSGSGTYSYGSEVTATVSITPEAYSLYFLDFAGWYEDDVLLSTNESYSFTMPSRDITCVAKFYGTPKEIGSTILFGRYPQTLVTNNSLIYELNILRGSLPDSTNSGLWNAYNWYISFSNETEFAWYIDLDVNDDGEKDYRGVYFVSYRPKRIDIESSPDYSAQDDHGYYVSTVYWFKYEPLEWRILDTSGGKFLVRTNKVIDSENFTSHLSELSEIKQDYCGDIDNVYPNNYKYSNLRTVLNTTFYETAFNSEEAGQIQTTRVCNDSSQTKYDVTDGICEDTDDKIFLLSNKEAVNPSYGLVTYLDRELKPTDYALCMGVYVEELESNTYKDCANYWLRSPGPDHTEVDGISSDGGGYVGLPVFQTWYGTVPAMCLM